MTKIHLDTDLGGDIDDLCALALLLRWPGGVELTGITTVVENDGRRAGYARRVLEMEGRTEIPVAAGADNALGLFREFYGLPDEARYWPEPVPPSPGGVQGAVDLLKQSVDQGAILVGIGPYTNLHLLEAQHPGSLSRAKLNLMGGYIYPTRAGFPDWRNDMDFNVQADVKSAHHVLQSSTPTFIPLSVTVETALRRAHLPGLRKAGPLGKLIARQAEAFNLDEKIGERFLPTCPGLPGDIINFQHDPLACAIALGWRDGVEMEELRVIVEERDGWLVERPDPTGSPAWVVKRVDGERFNQFWYDTLTQR